MLRRLLYHAFWNFYDHLGTYILVGILHALLSLGMVAIITHVSVTGYAMTWLLAAGLSIPLAVALAALLPFSARAARGEPVRWPALWQGMKQHVVKIGFITGAGLASLLVLLVNLRFYLLMQGKSNPYLFTVLAALDGWLIVIICFIFWPILCAISLPTQAFTLRGSVYRSFVWIVLLPVIWLFVGITGAILLWTAFVTRFGLLVYLPVMVVLAQTAAFLSVQYIDFLAVARNEDGLDSGIRPLKKRASELSLEWEAKQPRRTMKELIKPWEM